MTQDKPLRIGIVGAGGNTRKHHIPNLQAIAGVEVISVANRTRASGEKVAAEFGIPTAYDDWRALVEAPDTDAIVIGTWPYLHCPATLAALAAGKHVLTEARIALDATEARRMLAASRARPDLTCMVVPAPLTFPIDRTVAAKIDDGYLGQLIGVQVNASMSSFADFGGALSWRQDRDLSGSNVLNMGIWYECVMRWAGRATRVMARGRTVVNERKDAGTGLMRAVTIPDHLEVIADMTSGAIARLTVSAVSGLAPSQQLWLFGTEGTLHYDAGARSLSGGRRGDKALASIEIPADPRDAWRVEEEFVNAVRGLEPVHRTTFADGVRYMDFTDAVDRSIATGEAVRLPSD